MKIRLVGVLVILVGTGVIVFQRNRISYLEKKIGQMSQTKQSERLFSDSSLNQEREQPTHEQERIIRHQELPSHDSLREEGIKVGLEISYAPLISYLNLSKEELGYFLKLLTERGKLRFKRGAQVERKLQANKKKIRQFLNDQSDLNLVLEFEKTLLLRKRLEGFAWWDSALDLPQQQELISSLARVGVEKSGDVSVLANKFFEEPQAAKFTQYWRNLAKNTSPVDPDGLGD